MSILCLAACSGSETVEPEQVAEQPKAISLAVGLLEGQAVTRANLEDVLDDDTFYAWAYKNTAASGGNYTDPQLVMPGFTVNWVSGTAYTTTSNTNDWEYVGQGTDQTIKYWDFDAAAYRFFGYALGNATSPATPNAVSSATSANAVTLSSTVDCSDNTSIDAAPYFSELWFSNDKDNDYGKPVTLRFLKPFARVRFQFIFAEGLNFGREKLWDVKFWPTVNTDNDNTNDQTIATAGTVNVSYPLTGTAATTESWSTSSTTGIQAFTIDYYAQTTTPDPTNPETYPNSPNKWYYVLPAPSQGSYTLEVAVVSNEVKSVVVPAEYMNWKAGYEYTYKFKVTKGAVTLDIIQVGIDDWVIRNASEHMVYNW